MSTSPVNSAPDLGGWFVLALMLPGFVVLVGVVVAFVLSKPQRGGPARALGYYHVMGIDRRTNEPREATFHAAGEAAARGRAELDGILVTEVRLVDVKP